MVFGGVMEALSAVTTIAEKIFFVIKKVHKHYHYCRISHAGPNWELDTPLEVFENLYGFPHDISRINPERFRGTSPDSYPRPSTSEIISQNSAAFSYYSF